MDRMKWMVLAFFLLVTLSAGGQKGSSSQNGEVVTIKVFALDWAGPQKDLTRRLADQFEAGHPGIKVEVEEAPWDAFFQNIEIKLNAKTPDADVVLVDIPMMASYATRGFLEEITKYIPRSEFDEKIAPATLKDVIWNNKIYVAPLQNSAQYMYINKTLFDKYGVDLPPVYATKDTEITPEFAREWAEQAWDWDTLLAAARQLTKDTNGDGITDIYGLHIEQAARLYQLQPLGGGLGGKIVSPDGSKVVGYLDQPVWEKAVRFYGDLFNRYGVSNKAALGNFDYTNNFDLGKIAIVIGGEWNLKRINSKDFEMVIAGHPRWKDGKLVTPTGSWTLGIVKNAADKRKKAAAELIRWWSLSDEGTKAWFDLLGQIPASKYMLDQINSESEYSVWPLNVDRLGVYQVLHTAEGRPVTPYYPIVNEGFEKAFSDALQGKDPQKALQDAVQITQKKIDRLR